MPRVLVILSLVLGLSAAAAAETLPASVYVDSAPIGARIVLDGQLLAERTPALLRGLAAGKHTVALWKSGYAQITQAFTVSEGKVPQVKSTLPPLSVVVAFPAQDEVVTPQGSLPTEGRQFRYPSGTYYLAGVDASARMTPVFTDAPLVDTAGWSLLLSTTMTAVSGFTDYQRWRVGGDDGVSQVTLSLAASAAVDLVWYLTLQERKAKFYRETAPTIGPDPRRLDRAPALFVQGEEALQSGNLAAAEGFFRRVVSDFPDSRLVPGAWFRLAKIHSVTGRRTLALGEYRLVADTFPQAAYHDRARQAITDLYEAAGNAEGALANLERMTLTDDLFDPEAVAAQKARLQAALDAPKTPASAPAPVSTPESAAEAPTPRQSYDRVLQLFSQGHEFTASEWAGFEDLKARLDELDDTDTLADLNLVQRAVAAQAAAAETADGEEWKSVAATIKDHDSWVSLRNAGVAILGLSTAGTLFASSLHDRDPSDATTWAVRGAMSTMALSLFPLLWSEPRQ